MPLTGIWNHDKGGRIELIEDKAFVTIKHPVTGTRRVKVEDFYFGPSKIRFFGFVGTVEQDVIKWNHGATWDRGISCEELPDKYTAVNPSFPEWNNAMGDQENWSICLNIKPGDAQLGDDEQTDAFFFWQGTYFEMTLEGVPKSDKWSSKLTEIADLNGSKQVEAYVKSKLNQNTKVFWSPGKIRRWGAEVGVPGSLKQNNSENLLIHKHDKWRLVEVAPDGRPTEHALAPHILRRLTYPAFKLVGPPPTRAAADLYVDEAGISLCSEQAWINGSTVVRKGRQCPGRELMCVPESFKPIRYVPLNLREACLIAISKVPTCALTGATLMPTTQFASPDSRQIAEAIGEQFGDKANIHGIRVMASASMRGHSKLMSADHDFTAGFCKSAGCQAVHFKGSNLVLLHGEAWEMNHGISYMFEEERCDFSNHAKEAALMASLANKKSISFLANGGPTVAINLSRMLLLCGKGRVFTFTGLHSKRGQSGASGGFTATREKLESSIDALHNLSPQFFGSLKLPRSGDDIVAQLASKPLHLLNWDGNKGITETEYTVKPDCPNTDVNPGVQDDQRALDSYARGCAEKLCEELTRPG